MNWLSQFALVFQLEEHGRKNLVTRIKLLRARLFDTINNCQVITTDPNIAAKDRINAKSVKVQVSLAAFKLELEGFTSISRTLEEDIGLKIGNGSELKETLMDVPKSRTA